MHYYQFNIRDYRSQTVHLSPIEHYIYRTLIDTYYLQELPLSNDLKFHARRLGLVDTNHAIDSIQNVLDEFFVMMDDGYHHDRIDSEIQKFQQKSAIASKAGKASAAARSTKKQKRLNLDEKNAEQKVNDRSTNHKPLTINQEPIINSGKPESENKVSAGRVPMKVILEKWNQFATDHHLPKCVKLTSKIEGQIRSRWRDDLKELHHWDNYLSYIAKSKFLIGKAQPNGDRRPFRATLVWITNESNYAKIAAGEYHG